MVRGRRRRLALAGHLGASQAAPAAAEPGLGDRVQVGRVGVTLGVLGQARLSAQREVPVPRPRDSGYQYGCHRPQPGRSPGSPSRLQTGACPPRGRGHPCSGSTATPGRPGSPGCARGDAQRLQAPADAEPLFGQPGHGGVSWAMRMPAFRIIRWPRAPDWWCDLGQPVETPRGGVSLGGGAMSALTGRVRAR